MTSSHAKEAWEGDIGERWAGMADLMDRILAPVAEYLLVEAALSPAERVLDIGCGAGATTLAASLAVGREAGEVVGVDVSGPLLEVSRKRAELSGATNARFIKADAQSWTAPEAFDIAMSRFGVMFFDDSAAAFANIRSLLKPGGRILFLAWREPAVAEILSLPMQAIAPFMKEPLPKPEPDEPGPTRLADADMTHRLLDGAGWSNVSITATDLVLKLSKNDSEQLFDRTPLPALIAEHGLDADAVRAAYHKALDEKRGPDGLAHLKAGIWRISATA